VHRAAVAAHHRAAQRQPGDQLIQPVRGIGQDGNAFQVVHDLLRFLVIAGVTRIGRRTRRPEQHEAGAVRLAQAPDEAGKIFRRPAVEGFARADVHADDVIRGQPFLAQRLLRLGRHRRGRKHAHRRRFAVDAERRQQAEDILRLVQRLRQRVRHAGVDVLDSALARLGETDDVPGLDGARETQGARQKMRPGDDGVVEPLAAQFAHEQQPFPEHTGHALARLAVLGFHVGVYDVDVRIVLNHRAVVAVDQHADARLRKMFAQRVNQRCGAHQIADVVAADHEDARRGGFAHADAFLFSGTSATVSAAASPARNRNCCSM
jgi:hypothetical protein